MEVSEKNIRQITLVDDERFDSAIFIIDKWQGRRGFTLTIKYGRETWSYGWGAPGKDWIGFLASLDFGYTSMKMTDKVFDKDEFIKEWKQSIIEKRWSGMIDQELARKQFNAIKEADEWERPQDYLYHRTDSELGLNDPVDWPSGMIVPYAFQHLWKRFWPSFIDHIQKDVQSIAA
ncbi:MAG: hypothetical protein AAF388_01910 [Bacteroidota bacterium]